MVLKHTHLLLWSLAGAVLAHLALLAGQAAGAREALSASFRALLSYDVHANALLAAVVVVAFLLRRSGVALAMVRAAGDRPWTLAAVAFAALALGARFVYRAYPLSMDEYSALFQAEVFAAGRLAGSYPPELLDHLIPRFLQGHFLTVSRATGEVSATYWPGFSLLLAPFAWLGAPWLANPLLGALAIPAAHRLAWHVTGSKEGAAWAAVLCLASPAFAASSISYYSMQAHLLCNLLYLLLLLQPTLPRAALAGLVGSLALTLHNPLPHVLVALPTFAWLAWRRTSPAVLLALAAAYLPLGLLLGVGWREHLAALSAAAGAAPAASSIAQGAGSAASSAWQGLRGSVAVPSLDTLLARAIGASKAWTWGCAALLVLAAYGYGRLRGNAAARLLLIVLATNVLAYFLVRFDQGHGWGYRYLHPVWFVLPVLAAAAFGTRSTPGADEASQRTAAWATLLSLVLVLGLRAVQIGSFIDLYRSQVPPLAQDAAPQDEVLFIDIRRGFYTQDMIQNDPLLRAPRVIMVHGGGDAPAALMASRFPGYARVAAGEWGELWRPTPTSR